MALSTKLVTSALMAIILIIMLFSALSETASDVGSVASNFSETNDSACSGNTCPGTTFPLASLFQKKGVVLLAFMAGIVIVVIQGFFKAKK